MNIRPLTFLVGANSTGKSTILGCFQAMANFLSGYVLENEKSPITFNMEPYDMSDFTNIARRAKPKNTEFKLGLEIESEDRTIPNFYLQFTFGVESGADEPSTKEIFLFFKDGDTKFRYLSSPCRYSVLGDPFPFCGGVQALFDGVVVACLY